MRLRNRWKRIISLIMLPLLILTLIPTFSFRSKAAGACVTVVKDGKTFVFAMENPADFSLENYNVDVSYMPVEQSGYAYAADYPGYQWVKFQLKAGKMALENDQLYILNVTMPGNIEAVGKMTFYRDTTDEDRAQGVQPWYVGEDTVATASGNVLSIPVKKWGTMNNITVFGAVKVSESHVPEPEYEDGLYVDYIKLDEESGLEVPSSDNPTSSLNIPLRSYTSRSVFYIKSGKTYYLPKDEINKLVVTKDGNVVPSSDYRITNYIPYNAQTGSQDGPLTDGLLGFFFSKEGNYILTYKDANDEAFNIPINVNLADVAIYTNPEASSDTLAGISTVEYTRNKNVFYAIACSNRMVDVFSKYDCEIKEIQSSDSNNCSIEEITSGKVYKITINSGDRTEINYTCAKRNYTRKSESDSWVEGEQSEEFMGCSFIRKQGGEDFVIGLPAKDADDNYVFREDTKFYSKKYLASGINQINPIPICLGVQINEDDVEPVTGDFTVIAQNEAGYDTDDFELAPMDGVPGVWEMCFKKIGKYRIQAIINGTSKFANVEVSIPSVAIYDSSEATSESLLGEQAEIEGGEVLYINAVDSFMEDALQGMEVNLKGIIVTPSSATKFVNSQLVNDKQIKLTIADNCNVSFNVNVTGEYRNYVIINGEKSYGQWYSKEYNFYFENKIYESPAVASRTTQNAVELSWNNTGSSAYRVFRKAESGAWSILVDTDDLVFEDKTGLAGTTYIYAIRCINAAGTRYTSSLDMNKTATVKYPLIELASPKPTLAAANDGIGVSWSAVSGASKYRIFKRTGTAGWVVLKDVTGTSYKDAACKAGTKYTYAIRCLAADGTLISKFDSTKTAELVFPNKELVSPKPVLTAASDGISISWTAVEGSPKYRIFKRTGTAGWVVLKDVTGTSFKDTACKAGTKYTFAIRCLAEDGTTLLSKFDSTKTTELVFPASELVSPTPALVAASDGINISWTAVEGAARYRIFKRTGTAGWTVLTDVNGTSYKDTACKAGTKYTYAIRCLAADGTLISKFDSTKTADLVFPASEIKSPKPILSSVDNGISITWTAVEGAAKYRIFKRTGTAGWTVLTDVNGTAYTDTVCTAGTKYTYAVRCLDASGNLISKFDSSATSSINK